MNWLAPEVLRGEDPSGRSDIYSLGLVLWEMLYRAIPFGDFSIAQIIGAVGYGRRPLGATTLPGASAETAFLHEVVNKCAQGDPCKRPTCAALLGAFREMGRQHDARRAKRGVLGKLGDKTESFLAKNVLSMGLQRSLYGSDLRMTVDPKATPEGRNAATRASGSEASEPDGQRMVRLATGEWVRVDEDLLKQYPGDEDTWRALMAIRSKLPGAP